MNNYSVTFHRYIVRSVQHILSSDKATGPIWHLYEHKHILHILSYALKLTEAWSATRNLLLVMAPEIEKAGPKDEWIAYLAKGIQQSKFINDKPAEAELHLHLGMLYQLRGNFSEARTQFILSTECFEALNEPRKQAKALNRLAYIARLQGHPDEAIHTVEKALRLLNDEDWGQATSYFVKGTIAFDDRVWGKAARYFRRSLHLREMQGDKRKIARSLGDLGPALRAQGRYEEAIACYERAIELLEEVQDTVQQAVTRMNLGVVYLMSEQPHRALEHFLVAEPVLHQAQDELRLAMIYTNKGIAHRKLQEWKLAERADLASIKRWQQLGNIRSLVNAMDELGLVYLEQKSREKAITAFRNALDWLVQIEGKSGHPYLSKMVTDHLQQALNLSSRQA